jgi:RNA polymerase sigma-70 factor (ECF subfamily)
VSGPARRLLGGDPLRDPAPLVERVYAYVAYRIGDGPDAEDVTGDAFARAVRYRDSYDPAKGAPIVWLIGIARRCLDDARREPLLERDPPEPVAPGDLEGEAVTRVALWEAVGRLEERDRELIALRYGADMSAKQVARELGIRTNAAEVALHRALARLRPLVEGDAAPERRERAGARGGDRL